MKILHRALKPVKPFGERHSTLKSLLLHYTAIFDVLIGLVLMGAFISVPGDSISWEIQVIMGASPFWGLLFLASGVMAFIANIKDMTPLGRLALSVSAGLSAGRAVGYAAGAILLWPEFAVLILSSALIWLKQSAFLLTAVRKKETRLSSEDD